MKKTVIVLTSIFLSLLAKAECQYHDYHIKFMIETIDGNISEGYTFISSCNSFNMDSLENTEYLKTVLPKQTDDSLIYFQNRIAYEYQINSVKDTVYYYLGYDYLGNYSSTNEKRVSLKDIKTIKIESVVNRSSFVLILSGLQLSDTVWIKKEPVKSVSFSGYLCSHTIFIHIHSQKIDEVIQQLELKQKEIDKKLEMDILPTNINNNTHFYYDVDEEIWNIIEKLKDEKVVIVTECSTD